ncbi:MAG: PucR family transcriptional regulator [Allobranchiibius sp.]
MSISLRELLQIPQIDNTVIAGAAGLDAVVQWAHTCEMDQPWDWLGPEELLMTIGYCIPRRAAAQVAFVQQLSRSGLAGIAISQDRPSPPLTKAMLKVADELGFPVLITGHATPFAVIARAVASANQHEQLSRLGRLSRLSTELGRPARAGDRPMLSRIEAELGHPVYVIDARHGTEIFTSPSPPDPRIGPAVVAGVVDRIDRLPARLRIDLGEQAATCFPLPSGARPAMLVVPDSAAHLIDLFALLHVANLIAIELERMMADYARLRAESAELLSQLIDHRLDTQSAAEQLRRTGLGFPLVVAAFGRDAPVPVELLLDYSIAHLVCADTVGDGDQILLINADGVERLGSFAGPGSAWGTCEQLVSTSHLADAVREARWALASARAKGGGHVAYADAQPTFLPRTVVEAVNATRTILGPLLDRDEETGSELVRTLEVYLACDRSWGYASQVLQIHRQTIGYRLNQIETLTGRELSRTSDIADLWLALLALRIVQNPGDTPHGPRR